MQAATRLRRAAKEHELQAGRCSTAGAASTGRRAVADVQCCTCALPLAHVLAEDGAAPGAGRCRDVVRLRCGGAAVRRGMGARQERGGRQTDREKKQLCSGGCSCRLCATHCTALHCTTRATMQDEEKEEQRNSRLHEAALCSALPASLSLSLSFKRQLHTRHRRKAAKKTVVSPCAHLCVDGVDEVEDGRVQPALFAVVHAALNRLQHARLGRVKRCIGHGGRSVSRHGGDAGRRQSRRERKGRREKRRQEKKANSSRTTAAIFSLLPLYLSLLRFSIKNAKTHIKYPVSFPILPLRCRWSVVCAVSPL